MSYLTYVSKLFHFLCKAVVSARSACRIIDRVDKYVQGSNASDALKNQSTSVKNATNSLCEALTDYKANLPPHA